jgi:hypothetical protein
MTASLTKLPMLEMVRDRDAELAPARAEPAKLAYALNDVEFDVVDVDYQQMKSDMDAYPFGQCPRCDQLSSGAPLAARPPTGRSCLGTGGVVPGPVRPCAAGGAPPPLQPHPPPAGWWTVSWTSARATPSSGVC